MPDLERAELVKIYRSKGLTPDEARPSSPHHGRQEGLARTQAARGAWPLTAAQFENPVREGVVAGVSTLIGGVIPVIGYLGAGRSWALLSPPRALTITFVLCAVFLFLIGSPVVLSPAKPGCAQGLEMLAVGTAVAALTYLRRGSLSSLGSAVAMPRGRRCSLSMQRPKDYSLAAARATLA